MSAFTVAKTCIRSLVQLKKALINLGWKENQIELHSTKQALKGYQNDTREQKAELIIRRQFVGGSSNDIGFAMQADGTVQALISEYDKNARGLHGPYNTKFLDSVTQQYAFEMLKDQCTSNGFFLESATTDKNGFIQIDASNPHI